jgi:CBS-domain-containing membrane protein
MTRPLTVSDVMTKDVITVSVDTPFKTIAELFARHRVSAFPVTEEGAGLVGVVSETDLLRKQEHPESERGLLHRSGRKSRRKAAALTARDLMTSPMVTIELGSTLTEAARGHADR